MRSFRIGACYVLVSLLTPSFTLVGAAQQKPMSSAQVREVQIYLRQANGQLSELQGETAVRDGRNYHPFPLGSVPKDSIVLPGEKARLRFKQDAAVQFHAKLPAGTDPRQLELIHFESYGKQRWSLVEEAHVASSAPAPGSLSFKATRSADGGWILQPVASARVGEYCFSPSLSDQSFCFGVDLQ